MHVSVLTAYCNYIHDPTNAVLHRTLDGLAHQTWTPYEVFVGDDSHPDDRPAVKELCNQYGAVYGAFPFANYAFQYSRKYNSAQRQASGDTYLILCSSWWLAPNWIEEMGKWLIELDAGNIVSTDNDFQVLPKEPGSLPEDWFSCCPTRFQIAMPQYFDNAHFMLAACDWIAFDEEFDPPIGYLGGDRGSMHATVYWVWQQMMRGMKGWMRRDLKMEHGVMPRSPEVVEQVTKQVRWSEQVARAKGYPG